MDRLSSLFLRFSPTARVFHSGPLCRRVDFDARDGVGYLHLLQAGRLTVADADGQTRTLDQPSVLFYPRPCGHRLLPDEASGGATLLCASVEIGDGAHNPLARALPAVLVMPLASVPAIGPALELLFAEGFGERCGRDAALNRLMEYVLIQLLRHLLDSGTPAHGVLAALGDARLSRAVTAMHDAPEKAWTLEALAQQAGMSRARFAVHFRETVGATPLEYLTGWRLGVAQALLLKGRPVKAVARAVGYDSPAALSRVFARRLGQSPRAWLAQRESAAPAGDVRCPSG